MNINKKYVIKKAESTHYCSSVFNGIFAWSPHLKDAVEFDSKKDAKYIICRDVTLDKGERLLILPIYNTI